MAAPSPLWVPSRGEIIFIDHSPAKGKEIPDDHAMLVASPSHFNEKSGIVIGFPITHSVQHNDNPLALVIKCRSPSIRIPATAAPSYVLAFQPKSFDWRERKARQHAWGMGYDDSLEMALDFFDAICRLP